MDWYRLSIGQAYNNIIIEFVTSGWLGGCVCDNCIISDGLKQVVTMPDITPSIYLSDKKTQSGKTR